MQAVSVPLRAVRAAVFAAVCVALAACGHAWMSPDALPPWAPLVGFGAVFAVAFASAGRQRSPAAITALLGLGQLALHTLFASAAATAVPKTPEASAVTGWIDRLLCGPRDSAGHILLPAGRAPEEIMRNARVDPALWTSHTPNSHEHAHGSGPMLLDGGAAMLLAHVVAALLTGWWLWRGEAALFAVIALATAPLRVVLAVLYGPAVPVTETPGTTRRGGGEPNPTTHRAFLRHVVTRRGPPAQYALAC